MSAKLLLEHFDRLAEAPDAIPRLRQFMLDLAVRGKLVEQDSRDEPARELLARIQRDNLRAPARSWRHLDTGTDERSDFEHPFELPGGWVWAGLSRLIVFGPQNGVSPKPSSRQDAPKAITLTATTKGTFDPRHFKRVELSCPADSEYWLRPGDLLFQRGNTRDYVGIAAYYDGKPNEFVYPDLMIKVRLSPHVLLRFVHLSSVSPFARAYFSSSASGAQESMPKINHRVLLGLNVPLPPLAEQHRIVAKVDELMALCDRLEAAQAERERRRDRLVAASLHRLNTATDPDAFGAAVRFHICHHPRLITREEHLQSVRQTVLELAVTGRLVPQSSDRIPELTQNYQPAARECDETVSHSAPEELISSDDLQVPSSWAWKPIDDLVAKMDSGWSPQCEATPRGASSTWGVLKTTAVQRLAFSDKENKALPNKLRARPQYEARVGDVLVTRAGPKQRVGVCCVIDKVESRLMISDKIIRLRVLPIVDSAFIAIALNAGRSRWALEQAKSGMAVMQMNISQAKLREVPIPVPPLEEQHRIVARVGEIIAACDHLESQILAIQTRLRNALNGVLSAATR